MFLVGQLCDTHLHRTTSPFPDSIDLLQAPGHYTGGADHNETDSLAPAARLSFLMDFLLPFSCAMSRLV